MNDGRLDQLYQKMAEIVVDTIPEEWSKVYLYGEIVKGSQTAFFYYYPEDSEEPVYSHELTELFSISEHEYMGKWHRLVDFIQELWDVFKNSNQEPWTSFTMIFDSTGTFKMDYNYEDLSNMDPHERKTIWKYNNLGIVPKSNSGKSYLKKYLSSQKQ